MSGTLVHSYAAIYLLPVAPLWYEAIATNDALSYLRAEGSLEDEQAADKILYPAYGTYVGNSVSSFVPALGTPLYLAGVLGGHAAGRLQALRIAKERPEGIQQAGDEAPVIIGSANIEMEDSAPSILSKELLR